MVIIGFLKPVVGGYWDYINARYGHGVLGIDIGLGGWIQTINLKSRQEIRTAF